MQTGTIVTSVWARLTSWKQWLIIVLGICVAVGIGIYGLIVLVTQSPLAGDRIIIVTYDHRYAFILEAYRTEVLGLISYHDYVLSSIRDGIAATETLGFTSLSHGIVPR